LDSDLLRIKDTIAPVDGSAASFDALELACLLSRRNKGTVFAVYVIEVARTLPLDAEMGAEADVGEGVLQRAEEIAASLDCRIEGELLQARDRGHAIVDEAIDRGVDAVVMGVPYNRELGEFQLDETAQYVLKTAPCRVILCRTGEGG